MQLTQHLEKLELSCTNNKLTFKYVMKFGTDLSASLVLQKKFRVFKTRSHLVAHEENRKETSFFISIFSHPIYSRLCVDRVLRGPKLGVEVSNELVNVESRHMH